MELLLNITLKLDANKLNTLYTLKNHVSEPWYILVSALNIKEEIQNILMSKV